MKAPVGSVVGLYMDGVAYVECGDEIVTRTGRRYEVVRIRIQEKGMNVGRKHMRCRVMGPDEPRDPDVRVIPIYWYSR